MIIVSQDKDEIINFDNISSIVINDAWDDKPGQVIIATDVRENRHTLGYYKSEERAKEVLQEIIKSYRHYRTAECDGYTNVLEETAVFEIPKE